MADKNMEAQISVEFEEATSRQSLNSGDKINTLWSKVKRWLSDLKAVAFSGSYNDLSDIPTIPKLYNSTGTNTDGAITQKAITDVIDTKADTTNLTSHIDNKSNPHSVTKSQVGLGNVGNFKAVSTVASQGLTDSEKLNARTNIGAGTSSFSGNYNDLSNKPTIPSAVTESTVSGWGFTKNTGTYSKPSTGIPASDLASGVIPTSLPASNVTDTYSATGTDPVSGKAVASAISNKVDKISGKGLSTNDLTAALKSNYDAAYTHSQSAHAPSSAQANVIETIKVNNTALTPTNKTVNITIPSNTDRYVNSANFADDSTATAASPVKMTLTRAGSDTNTITANIPKVSSSSAGVVPKGSAVSSQSTTTKFLREDGTWATPSYTTNTDTKVTAVGNHYTPAKSTTKSASGGTLTDITNSASGTQVITGVEMDAKGHVTGVTSVALKSTDTKVTVDSALSSTSTNPVQNKVVSSGLAGKAEASHTHTEYALKSKYGDTTINVGRKSGTDVGDYSTAEGFNTISSGHSSHAEGNRTTAKGHYSHAEGLQTQAIGGDSHAEGAQAQAIGDFSHAEGCATTANGDCSSSHGYYTQALHDYEASFGKYNVSNDDTLFSIGDGTTDNERHNAFEITTTGGKLHDKDIATLDDIPTSLPANGGNADTVDGHHADYFAKYDNPSIEGQISLVRAGNATTADSIFAWEDTLRLRNQDQNAENTTYTDLLLTPSGIFTEGVSNGNYIARKEISTTPIKKISFPSVATNAGGGGVLFSADFGTPITIACTSRGDTQCTPFYHGDSNQWLLLAKDCATLAPIPAGSYSFDVWYI